MIRFRGPESESKRADFCPPVWPGMLDALVYAPQNRNLRKLGVALVAATTLFLSGCSEKSGEGKPAAVPYCLTDPGVAQEASYWSEKHELFPHIDDVASEEVSVFVNGRRQSQEQQQANLQADDVLGSGNTYNVRVCLPDSESYRIALHGAGSDG